MKKYERGDLPRSNWLDKLAFRKMEEVHAVLCSCQLCVRFTYTGDEQAETEKSENLFLYIDLPRFDFPVIFSEPVGCEFCCNYISSHLIFPGNSCRVVCDYHCSTNRSYSCHAINIVYIHYRSQSLECDRSGCYS